MYKLNKKIISQVVFSQMPFLPGDVCMKSYNVYQAGHMLESVSGRYLRKK